jgi:hypothetical protein
MNAVEAKILLGLAIKFHQSRGMTPDDYQFTVRGHTSGNRNRNDVLGGWGRMRGARWQ